MDWSTWSTRTSIASLGFRLTLPEALVAVPEGSNREVAKVAGVSEFKVRGARNIAPDAAPVRRRGADGKSYPGGCPAWEYFVASDEVFLLR